MKRYVLLLGVLLCCIMLKAQSLTYICRYWFDQNHEQAVTASFNGSTWQSEIDVGLLSDGFHKLHLQIADTAMHWSSPQSYLFFKIADTLQEDFTCHYWFDQNHAQMQHLPLGNGLLLLNVSDLEDGMHTVNVLLEGDALTTTTRYVFMKVPVDNPFAEYQYHCWFDNDISTMRTGLLGSGCFQLETDGLTKGFHTVSVQLDDNGTLSAPQLYMFYNQPLGGYGISRWAYWLNDDINNRITTNMVPSLDTLDIISLLPVETWPIRSTCFHFQPNGEEPYINAKNKVSFRFWDTEDYWIDQSAYYVDENVSEPIVADTLERNTITTIPAPRDNQIHWFKVEANRGDYLSFQSDKACTMQLFAPSGEEVYAASGPESIQEIGFNVWENGTYYLAVHDVMGSGETVSITYNWVYRYVIGSCDVHVVGNGGRSTITFQGNGFDNLLDVYLVNAQNDTISWFDIGHESNTTTTVTFDFNGVALGDYKAVFHFIDEDLTMENCIKVEEATPFVFEANASFASRFLINTSNKYVFQVRNNSNMTAYDVPLAVYVFTPDAESLTRVDIGGFNFKSYIREILGSYYSDSLDNVIEQKRLVSGDLFGLLEDFDTDFIPDAPCLHYTFITPTLRPNTTETFTISVSSTNSVSVYIWYPDEWENMDSTEYLSRTRSVIDNRSHESVLHYQYCSQKRQLEEMGGGCGAWCNIQCPPTPPSGPLPPGPGGESGPVYSLDPNDIHGYLSESGSHYMRQEIQNVQYEIEFENDTTLATAAAHTIIVRDTLDATKFDLNSLAARSVTIGDKRLDLNGEQTFARTLDLRPELYVIAQVEQDYDPTTGIIQWTIQSLDPMTMEPTNDPNQGVLPVNYYGNGVGFIDYSVNLKHAFPDGTKIRNRAGIIFDQNDVIMTPIWTNIIDAVKPTSYIENVTFEADTLNFSFVSSDNRSGVWYHTLYYRNDSTEMEWKVKVPKIVENSYMLRFNEYQTTEYLVMAVDSAGNHEEKDMVAEYIHYYDGPVPVCQTDFLEQGWNWWSTYIEANDVLEQLKTSLGTNGIQISTQGGALMYRNGRWIGTLTSIENGKGYKIRTSAPVEVSVTGRVANPADYPITIARGWNWIGYPLSENETVGTALAGFTPSDGDVITTQGGAAIYGLGRWLPSGFTFEPGKGYVYKSTSTASKTLIFSNGRKTVLKPKTKAQQGE